MAMASSWPAAGGCQGVAPVRSRSASSSAVLQPSDHSAPAAFTLRKRGLLGSSWAGVTAGALGVVASNKGRASARNIRCVRRAETVEPKLTVEFVVYMEDTDCFQVVFYANYFRFFQRALNELYDKDGRGRPAIIAAKDMRYRSAAKLGDLLQVSLYEVPDDGLPPDAARWKVVSATTAECVLGELLVTTRLPQPLSRWPEFQRKPLITRVGAREEFASPVPSVHDIMRWFERSRSDSLGGPGALQEVVDMGILIVVARIDDFEYDPSLVPAEGAGLSWEVQSEVSISRSKLFCDERLVAFAGSQEGSGITVARAVVTCVCIDVASFRITRAPKQVLEMIQTS